jgi:hypothetical protein
MYEIGDAQAQKLPFKGHLARVGAFLNRWLSAKGESN